jgi:hypothetical protein
MEGREEYRSTLAHRQVLYSVINTLCTVPFTTHSLIEIFHTLYRTEETSSWPLFETDFLITEKKERRRGQGIRSLLNGHSQLQYKFTNGLYVYELRIHCLKNVFAITYYCIYSNSFLQVRYSRPIA